MIFKSGDLVFYLSDGRHFIPDLLQGTVSHFKHAALFISPHIIIEARAGFGVRITRWKDDSSNAIVLRPKASDEMIDLAIDIIVGFEGEKYSVLQGVAAGFIEMAVRVLSLLNDAAGLPVSRATEWLSGLADVVDKNWNCSELVGLFMEMIGLSHPPDRPARYMLPDHTYEWAVRSGCEEIYNSIKGRDY